MARKDTERDPVEQNDDRGIGTGSEGRMPAGGDDVRGVADEGEDAFESDEDDLEDDDSEQDEGF